MKKANENKKRRQARKQGLFHNVNHRSHIRPGEGIRSWRYRQHIKELKEAEARFESGYR